jgi:predicted alpha/beta hydrolase
MDSDEPAPREITDQRILELLVPRNLPIGSLSHPDQYFGAAISSVQHLSEVFVKATWALKDIDSEEAELAHKKLTRLAANMSKILQQLSEASDTFDNMINEE